MRRVTAFGSRSTISRGSLSWYPPNRALSLDIQCVVAPIILQRRDLTGCSETKGHCSSTERPEQPGRRQQRRSRQGLQSGTQHRLKPIAANHSASATKAFEEGE